jgi:hypothetical protein
MNDLDLGQVTGLVDVSVKARLHLRTRPRAAGDGQIGGIDGSEGGAPALLVQPWLRRARNVGVALALAMAFLRGSAATQPSPSVPSPRCWLVGLEGPDRLPQAEPIEAPLEDGLALGDFVAPKLKVVTGGGLELLRRRHGGPAGAPRRRGSRGVGDRR